MNTEQAKQALGLEATVSNETALAELTKKRAQIEEKLAAAPTDALKGKFQQMQQKLDEVEQSLKAESFTSSRSPLSETKMADLPGSAPRGSQGDAGGAPQLELKPGDTLAGRYEIKEQIGAGGMGAVYRAHDQNRAQDIAIKVLLPSLTAHEGARERFLDEARLSSQLSHPGIVNVYDVQHDGDFYFLTMELLEGQDLRQVMENRKLARQPFSIEEVQELIGHIATALDYAHKHTVHRDIKPENIWMTEADEVKLMDFGIARLMSTSQRTQTGAAMGTAYYMAPEQLKGSKNIDGRADQYALAVMAYELLTGEVPAGAMIPINELRKDVPKALAAAITKALSPKPELRYESAGQFSETINSARGGGIALPAINAKVAGIAAGVLLLIGIGVMAANGGLGDVFKGLLPESEEVIQARYMEAVQLEGEIKDLAERLANLERDDKQRLREAEQENKRNAIEQTRAELAHRERVNQLLQQAIFTNSLLTELKGKKTLGETMNRDKKYQASIPVLKEVKAGYEQLLAKSEAVEPMFWAKDKAEAEKENYEQLTGKYGLTPDAAKLSEAQTLLNQAEKSARQGLVAEAKAAYEQGQGSYSALLGWAQGEAGAIDEQNRQAAEAKRQADAEAKRQAEAQRQAAQRRLNVMAGEFVTIPSGSYRMGSTDGDSDEKPVHTVHIQKFRLGKYEVTQKQWQAVMGENPSDFKDCDDCPVESVSWDDIQTFLTKLNRLTGKTFRLPSEAEWEYAARAGSSSKYPWGNQASHEYANYGRDECCDGLAQGRDRWVNTAPVGKFPANAFGLYDMHGNAWEWTQDCLNDSYSGAPTNGSAWLSGNCAGRVVRGGSWFINPWGLRSADRNWAAAFDRIHDGGFRLAQDAP